ncbi:hypothetical protein LEL_05778 [Akanthomyces lecanii RCEF 1005]|uniref:Uncharacterized protein n=1 Tax=Akanthomyces lecanii RCEF 1005 TaxID=1081108 RepID=A0A168G6D8_CORDF|nr:hypothetical protein LEL_05778 [Akanthomyces lecanii RCEF 1005]
MNIDIESPSRAVHQERIKSLEFMLKKNPEAKLWERAVAEKCEFMDQGKHIFGHLYAASGCGYGKDGAFLDWALIDVVHGRMGDNRLPDGETWPTEQYEDSPPDGLDGLGQPTDLHREPVGDEPEPVYGAASPSSMHRMMWDRKHAQEAYQLGTTGESTTGQISRHKAAVRWGPDDVASTTEAVFDVLGHIAFMLEIERAAVKIAEL